MSQQRFPVVGGSLDGVYVCREQIEYAVGNRLVAIPVMPEVPSVHSDELFVPTEVYYFEEYRTPLETVGFLRHEKVAPRDASHRLFLAMWKALMSRMPGLHEEAFPCPPCRGRGVHLSRKAGVYQS